MDFNILYFIDKLHNPFLDKIMIFITHLGDAGIFWLILAFILVCFKKTRKCGILIFISMFIGFLIGNLFLKNLIARNRPCWIDKSIPLLIKNPEDFSFPSGHTLASFAASITIFLQSKKWGIPVIILACLIAFSRAYLFVHFPTDILAGFILGTIISISVFYINKKYFNQKIQNQIEKIKNI